MKKAILTLVIVFIFSPVISAQHSGTRKEKFLYAKSGESWMITDEWSYVWDEPDSAYDDWRYIFRNKYSLTWHDFFHVVDMIKRYQFVSIEKTTGYIERWKYVTYAKKFNGKLRIRKGWILGTTVERAAKVKIKKRETELLLTILEDCLGRKLAITIHFTFLLLFPSKCISQ